MILDTWLIIEKRKKKKKSKTLFYIFIHAFNLLWDLICRSRFDFAMHTFSVVFAMSSFLCSHGPHILYSTATNMYSGKNDSSPGFILPRPYKSMPFFSVMYYQWDYSASNCHLIIWLWNYIKYRTQITHLHSFGYIKFELHIFGWSDSSPGSLGYLDKHVRSSGTNHNEWYNCLKCHSPTFFIKQIKTQQSSKFYLYVSSVVSKLS